jgi:hypothetical protein
MPGLNDLLNLARPVRDRVQAAWMMQVFTGDPAMPTHPDGPAEGLTGQNARRIGVVQVRACAADVDKFPLKAGSELTAVR